MDLIDVLRNEIIRLNNLNIPVGFVRTIGLQLSDCIHNLQACVEALEKQDLEDGDDGK